MLRIGVDIGASQHGAGTRRLLDALSLALPVSFLDRAEQGLDGLLTSGERPAPAVPALFLPPQPGARLHPVARVTFEPSAALPRPLRGRSIEEGDPIGPGQPPAPADREGQDDPIDPSDPGRSGDRAGVVVLARADGEAAWWQEGAAARISRYPLATLEQGETLRERLRPGRFMGLLPLVHFLQELLVERLGWQAPPLRASFIVDDPNLHWPSYGFLDYRELARHAREHRYHLGLATVPLDGWRSDRRAAALLAANPDELSLLMHGNDHVTQELGRLTATSGPPAIAQALRRVAALERRSGLKVERVMAPPHGACSREALEAMFAFGLEAACISRPYPWLDGSPAPTPLAGFAPAELVAGGMPVLARVPLSAPREDLALRALLGQPLILYGHHGDFRDGLDVLAAAAADVNALGEARWQPLGPIARASTTVRREGPTQVVRMHARLADVEVPDGVQTVRVEVPEPAGGSSTHTVRHPAGFAELEFSHGLGVSEPIALGGGERLERLRLELVPSRPLRSDEVPSPGPRLWPLVRRIAVEGRDRLQPLTRRP